MTANVFEQLFSHLPQGDRISQLEKITKEQPFFAAAHYCLLQELPVDSDAWKVQARKTALHFSPYQLAFLQNKEEEEVSTSLPPKEEKIVSTDNGETNTEEVITVTEVPKMTSDLQEEKEDISAAQTIEAESPEEVQHENIDEEEKNKNILASIPLPRENEAAQGPLLFEPLHTSDYFASQGIRITDEMQPKDKLGKQLKSFTAWLQTMKKLNEAKLPATDSNTEKKIIKLAEKSNQEAEVVTEAMAEAHLIQGKPAKAIEIYEKLKLLNPDKSSFFAAKINELQGNTL